MIGYWVRVNSGTHTRIIIPKGMVNYRTRLASNSGGFKYKIV